MGEDGLAKDGAGFVVPVAGFASGAEGVLVKSSAIWTGPARIAFCEVGANGTGRAVKLIGNADRSRILNQLGGVWPSQVEEKQGQSICLHPPNPIPANGHRHAFGPLLKGHADSFTSRVTSHESAASSIYLSHHDIDGADDRRNVGEKEIFAELVGDGEVDEGGGADFDAIGDDAALGFDVEAEMAAGIFV